MACELNVSALQSRGMTLLCHRRCSECLEQAQALFFLDYTPSVQDTQRIPIADSLGHGYLGRCLTSEPDIIYVYFESMQLADGEVLLLGFAMESQQLMSSSIDPNGEAMKWTVGGLGVA